MKTLRLSIYIISICLLLSCIPEINDKHFTTLFLFDPENIPVENTWVIMDDNSTAKSGVRVVTNWEKLSSNELQGDFYNLYTALLKANIEGRNISLVFPNLDSIPSGAFFDFTSTYTYDNSMSNTPIISLKSINAPKAKSVGLYSLAGIQSEYYAYFPELQIVNNYAFSNSAIEVVNFPSVTHIGKKSFYQCDYLVSIKLQKLTIISEESIMYCGNLKYIYLPKVSVVEDFGISYCDGLEECKLPKVEIIDSYGLLNNYNTTYILATESKALSIDLEAFTISRPEIITLNNIIISSLGVATDDNIWEVEGKEFGPFENIIIQP